MSISGPVINFEGYRINKLHYDTISADDYQKKYGSSNDTNIEIKGAMDTENHIGTVKLNAQFGSKVSGYRQCMLELDGSFTLREDLTQDDAKKFLATNGAAMLYPYLRTIVSMITALDDPKVTVLPSLNFADEFRKSHKP
ncbi:hypothetical protein LNA02_21120 [Levilactobacillus namurensis]|uniref:protein-export chaperone SecB n=1 Tax=Levilactobacillus namurensis TaxID=380393 RepID=UPI00070561D8|nr:protein-export chaperone SecB [Levilactobacillus namurensis]GEO75414.1 hypothetical protein LNA02_21120 [Levilactobacillus namurensis]